MERLSIALSALGFLCVSLPPSLAQGSMLEAETKLGRGIGPFHFGMSPKEVNGHFPHPFGPDAPLPVAEEWRPVEVRYYWLHTADFPAPTSGSSPFEALRAFQSCWGGQTNIVFLFAQNSLSRISLRLFPDCGGRNKLADDFAKMYSITPARSGTLGYRRILGLGTVEIRFGRNATTVEVFKTGSPAPNESFWDTLH